VSELRSLFSPGGEVSICGKYKIIDTHLRLSIGSFEVQFNRVGCGSNRYGDG